MTIDRITNRRLAVEIDKRLAVWHKTSKVIFDLAEHHEERFSEIVYRLGPNHPAVQANTAALAARWEAEGEGRARLGPGNDVVMVALLLRSPRYIRNVVAP